MSSKQKTDTNEQSIYELMDTHLERYPPTTKPQPITPQNTPPPAFKRLVSRGQVPVDAQLDLHGKTLDEAYAAIDQLLTRAQAQGWQFLRVITGKGNRAQGGRGVLVQEVPAMLQYDKRVAEVVQAVKAKDGGQGAWFVRVRKR